MTVGNSGKTLETLLLCTKARIITDEHGLGAAVLKISLPWFANVSSAIDAIDELQPNIPIKDQWYPARNADNYLQSLFDQSVYAPYLIISRQKSIELRDALIVLTNPEDSSSPLTEFDSWNIKSRRNIFRTVFHSEIGIIPCYLVSRKEGYDTNILVDKGILLFPAGLVAKAPDAASDAVEAGRAIAFELPTAAGFHIFRATESVIRRYWDMVSGGAKRPKPETIGTFARELSERNYGDLRIAETLKQIAKLHRNPLIHPEVLLTLDEAIETLGIARSAIGAMLKALPDVPPTTLSPAALLTPET